jgi:UDP-glucose:(heptosyl)LPS alpha-1,3-glucosyltransferase
MKIILAVFQIGKRGGKERDALAVAGHLAARGHEVTLLTTTPDASVPALRTVTLPRSGLGNHARARNFARAVMRHAAIVRPDAVIAFERIPGADFFFAADAAMAPRLGGAGALLPRRRTYRALERGVAGPAARTHIFFLTQRQRDDYHAIYGLDAARSTVLPPILHDERYRAIAAPTERDRIRAQLNVPAQAVLAAAIAVQPRQKGVDRSLAALPAFHDLHLLVAGSSDDWIMDQARALKIADRVHVLPYADNVMALLSAADVLLHPARAEAAGQVIGEALLAGTPAIVSGICGYGDAVARSGAGVVLPEPFATDEYARAIATTLQRLPVMRAAAEAESRRLRSLQGHWLTVITETVEQFAASKPRTS